MKKFLAGLIVLFVFAVTVPVSVQAQHYCNGKGYHRGHSNKRYNARNYNRGNNRRFARQSYSNRYYGNRRYSNRQYANRGYSNDYYSDRYYNNNRYANGYTYRRPSLYRRHRNLINVGVATGAGALIGGLIKGKKGALIGAAIGAGSGALYTYGIRPKKRRY